MKKFIFLSNLILINFHFNAQQYLNKDFSDSSLTSGGWSTQIITGTTDWFVSSFSGDDFIKISNYNNNQNSTANTWLISNPVDLSSASMPSLSFETIMKFPGDPLVLHVSTDYDGTSNPNSQGTWTDITSFAIWDVDNAAWGNWTLSGGVDLTSYISSATYIAFEYSGSNTDGSTWEIDNIKINEGTSPPTGLDTVSIYDIQYTNNSNGSSNYDGLEVYTGGIVTAVRNDKRFYLSSGSGPWSGIYVYSDNYIVNIGDSLTFKAEVVEFNNLTELKNITNFQNISSGNFTSVNVCNTAAVSTEEFEGCLVKITNAVCNNTNAGFGQWTLNDGSGDINIGDFLYDYPNPTMNSVYDVTGIVDFSFSEFKLLPRSSSDISQSVSIDENSITNFDFYPNPLNSDNLNVEVDKNSSIILYDYSGKIIRSFSLNPGINNLNLSNISKGLYLIKYDSETYMFSKI